MKKSPRISIAHHWLVSRRGGEQVLEQLCQLFPDADVSTLVYDKSASGLDFLKGHSVRQSMLASLPAFAKFYKSLLPFFPEIVSRLEASPCDMLISSDASVVKGLKVPDGVPHVCYCHSPPRYVWDMVDVYKSKSTGLGPLGRMVFENTVPRVRKFDKNSSAKVTEFIANSKYVANRIETFYGRTAEVIPPPVLVRNFDFHHPKENFFLCVGQLVPYKRIDLAVDAFNRLGLKLVVIGDGSELASLKRKANSNITFLGGQPFPVLKDYLQRCKAFVFPGIEDFGITPLESQACGSPVIAFRGGGALETVVENETGLFFDEQTPESLVKAIEEFQMREHGFVAQTCRSNAMRFSPEHFQNNIKSFLRRKFPDFVWPT